MPLLTSVAVYEVRQSSRTKDCSAPAVTKQIMAACGHNVAVGIRNMQYV